MTYLFCAQTTRSLCSHARHWEDTAFRLLNVRRGGRQRLNPKLLSKLLPNMLPKLLPKLLSKLLPKNQMAAAETADRMVRIACHSRPFILPYKITGNDPSKHCWILP